MTKPRPPLSFSQAITRVVGIVGVDEAARVVNRSVSLVQKWTDRDSGKAPNLHQSLALDTAFRVGGGDGAPILESYTLQMDVALADRFADSFAIARCLASLSQEHGEAIGAALHAIQPGAPAGAIHRAIAESEQSVSAAIQLVALLKSFLTSGAGPVAMGGGTTEQ